MDRVGLRSLIYRWKNKTPAFEKKMQLFFVRVAAAGVILAALPEPAVAKVGTYMVTASTIAALGLQFCTNQPIEGVNNTNQNA